MNDSEVLLSIAPCDVGQSKKFYSSTSISFSSCKIWCSLGGMCSVLMVVLCFIQKVWCGQAWDGAGNWPSWWEWVPFAKACLGTCWGLPAFASVALVEFLAVVPCSSPWFSWVMRKDEKQEGGVRDGWLKTVLGYGIAVIPLTEIAQAVSREKKKMWLRVSGFNIRGVCMTPKWVSRRKSFVIQKEGYCQRRQCCGSE